LSYLAHTQTDRQTDKQIKVWQKHNLLGDGNKGLIQLIGYCKTVPVCFVSLYVGYRSSV